MGVPLTGVIDAAIDDLEDAAGSNVVLHVALAVDSGFLGDVAGAEGVELLVPGHADRVGIHKGVLVAAYRGVDTDVEEVLVVRGHDAVANAGAEGDVDVLVDGLGGEDSSGAGLEGDLTGLVEDPGEDVLVVCDGDDLLEDELTLAHDRGVLGAVVGVLPLDALVNLVDADGVWLLDGLAVEADAPTAEILDHAETVAADLAGGLAGVRLESEKKRQDKRLTSQVVRGDAGADVAQIKGTLAVDGVARVAVGDEHLGEREAVEGTAVHEANVVDGHALAPVEADAEAELLPLDEVPSNLERGTLGLDDVVRLHGGARRVLLETVGVLGLKGIGAAVRNGAVDLGGGLIGAQG